MERTTHSIAEIGQKGDLSEFAIVQSQPNPCVKAFALL